MKQWIPSPRSPLVESARGWWLAVWGVARHVNYLGEILMSLGLALAPGHFGSVWPWLYPAFMIAFMLTRERADERRCAAKYGPLWDRYCERVRYRIIPRVY